MSDPLPATSNPDEDNDPMASMPFPMPSDEHLRDDPDPAEPESVTRLRARTAAIVESFRTVTAHQPAHETPVTDDLAERRVQNQRDAWRNSLAACDKSEYADRSLSELSDDQHGDTLRTYAHNLAHASARNLVFAGRVGAGKTTAACAIARAGLEQGMSARFMEHSKYLLWLRPDQMPAVGPYRGVTANQLRARMRHADVLVLDDLGASLDPAVPVTQFVKDETLTLLGDRLNTPGRITIITTNRKPDELVAMFGEQFLSRLSQGGVALTFLGPDRRGRRLTW